MPTTFPNGSVYYEDGDFFVLPNGIHLANGPNAQADINRFLGVPIKAGGSLADMDPALLRGASTFPNGSVYFPQGDFFVLQNGRVVGNTPQAPNFGATMKKFVAMRPVDTRTPPWSKPPVAPDPANPPGRPTVPGVPVPAPIPKPDDPGGGRIPTPTPTPTPLPDKTDNFNKGQLRDALMPNGSFTPTADGFTGDRRYNPYRGQNGPLGPGAGATGYDPDGIGADNYGGQGYDGLPGSASNEYSLTGANSANGDAANGMPRFGLVGGQGGFGVGMVGPEYSGPIFDNVKDALHAMRRQRRLLNKPTTANPNNSPVAPGGITSKGGQPTTPGTTPAPVPTPTPTPGANPAPDPTAGWSAPDAHGNVHTPDGRTLSPWDQQYEKSIAGGKSSVAGVTQSHTDVFGNGLQPGQDTGYDAKTQTLLSPSLIHTPFGDLTQASGGNSNIFKKVGGSDEDWYHYDPEHLGPGDDPSGWKHGTSSAQYAGYGDHAYTSPYSSAARARQAGAATVQYGWGGKAG